ncbi:MAG: hypothetical protein AB1782_04415 [Cyanobacteriota bacterium]
MQFSSYKAQKAVEHLFKSSDLADDSINNPVNIIKPKTRIIEFDNNIMLTIDLPDDEQVSIKLPRPAYYFDLTGISEKDGQYQYLQSLSDVLKELADNPKVDSNSVKVNAFIISDMASIYNSIPDENFENFYITNVDYDHIMDQSIDYFKAVEASYRMLSDERSYSEENIFNLSDISKYENAISLSASLEKVQSEKQLSNDIKILVSLITDQVEDISDNYILSISAKDFSECKGILINLVKETSLENNTKNALISSLNAPLRDNLTAETFINTLSTILNSSPEGLKQLTTEEKTRLIDTIVSLKIKKLLPVKQVIKYDLSQRFNCLNSGGVINKEGSCLIK